MGTTADAKLDLQVSIAKKRNPVYQIPARTEEHAVLNKMVTPARATQTSEEKYVKSRTCVPQIHVFMKERASIWITTLSSASVRKAGLNKTVKKRIYAFLTLARMKGAVMHMDLELPATVL